MGRYTFGKAEKLCSKLEIDALFKHGESFKVYPIRVLHMRLENGAVPAKLLISVPKKRFKNAVSRNQIKRLIRETYRLNKPELIENWGNSGKYFALAFVYIGNDIIGFNEMTSVMKQLIDKLNKLEE
ncbi:MAG: hypothetical protein RL266_1806 [Bacteroidota bacterium]|jgi:ribonuclease P protein component